MTTEEKMPLCDKCQHELEWHECWQCCGEGISGHDCGDDTCCCFMPEDNVRCDICRGKGGWRRCYECAPLTADERD